MWVYLVIYLTFKATPIPCPNGLVGCAVNHYRQDTLIVEKRFCERAPALWLYHQESTIDDIEYNWRGISWDEVRFDSVWVRK